MITINKTKHKKKKNLWAFPNHLLVLKLQVKVADHRNSEPSYHILITELKQKPNEMEKTWYWWAIHIQWLLGRRNTCTVYSFFFCFIVNWFGNGVKSESLFGRKYTVQPRSQKKMKGTKEKRDIKILNQIVSVPCCREHHAPTVSSQRAWVFVLALKSLHQT